MICFWSVVFKAFIFQWGMLSSIVLDVAAILGLPISGKLVHPCLLPKKSNFGYVHPRGVYSTFITKNAKTEMDVSNTEHSAFFMCLFSKLFYDTASVGVVKELQPFIFMMLSGIIHSWEPFFLAGLYKGMQTLLDQIQQNGVITKISVSFGFYTSRIKFIFPTSLFLNLQLPHLPRPETS